MPGISLRRCPPGWSWWWNKIFGGSLASMFISRALQTGQGEILVNQTKSQNPLGIRTFCFWKMRSYMSQGIYSLGIYSVRVDEAYHS